MTRALVIGCGGTIGGAWIVAALAALAERLDWDPREADILQGTSAGAELVAMLSGGYGIDDLVAMQSGRTDDGVLRRHVADTPPSLPRVPFPAPIDPSTLWRGGRGHSRLTGIAPRGRGDAAWLQRLAEAVAGPDGWLPHPGARLVAYDPRRHERVAFGAPGAPAATAGEALRASWAIPAWMPPVPIDGNLYVDGGAASTASVDLVPPDVDEVFVLAPMASRPGVRAPGTGGIAEYHLLRKPMSALLFDEAEEVRARGAAVVTITPDAEDLRGLGSHFMARGRRADAFTAARSTAPASVARALAEAGL
ncbi:patatin-like phospholipase family protein [Tsukamurella sp. 8F]|uniref:patatin-like phospholipase family protein n=1 Tax=unclassified Tsukamurella TaxID=2633480 RepID=UPI0023B9332A|nr:MULTISPECIES: patatin-like phospholipase family protein [unclassified Tsukamurella]MDF0529112.1 patatin-like phospholipase family protein [Tsukamurella sp. 8J]MDF0588138.1 patatin-like phospholipase family protein [Tsukamurella sp. 8F]